MLRQRIRFLSHLSDVYRALQGDHRLDAVDIAGSKWLELWKLKHAGQSLQRPPIARLQRVHADMWDYLFRIRPLSVTRSCGSCCCVLYGEKARLKQASAFEAPLIRNICVSDWCECIEQFRST
jgi:hypothetical protein